MTGKLAGKVALVSATAALTGACPSGGSLVDLVGYGTSATCSEGSHAALYNVGALHFSGVGVPRDDVAFRNKVNDLIQQAETDGTWQRIYDATLGKSGTPATPPTPMRVARRAGVHSMPACCRSSWATFRGPSRSSTNCSNLPPMI